MKLLLIDGPSVARTVYEANPAPDSVEKVLHVFRSTLSSMRRLVTTYGPTHALIAFDAPGPTWRHQIYPAYKRTRKPAPEVLTENWQSLLADLDNMGLRTLSVPGLEAEDIMASASSSWSRQQLGPIVAVSKDKDLVRLVAHGATIFHPFTGEQMGDDWALAKYGVPARLVPDMLALLGDSADDIPGVAGVGVKTAARLLLQFGSFDEVLISADEIRGAVGKLLQSDPSSALLSKQLVALKEDATLGLRWKELAL